MGAPLIQIAVAVIMAIRAGDLGLDQIVAPGWIGRCRYPLEWRGGGGRGAAADLEFLHVRGMQGCMHACHVHCCAPKVHGQHALQRSRGLHTQRPRAAHVPAQGWLCPHCTPSTVLMMPSYCIRRPCYVCWATSCRAGCRSGACPPPTTRGARPAATLGAGACPVSMSLHVMAHRQEREWPVTVCNHH